MSRRQRTSKIAPNVPDDDVLVTRANLAIRWGVNGDSVTRLLPAGLATAIAERGGGAGRPSRYSLWMADRFYLAWTCRRRDPSQATATNWCERCFDVVRDAEATAESGEAYSDFDAPLPCRPILLEAGAGRPARSKGNRR